MSPKKPKRTPQNELTEEQFLARYDTAAFPHPSVAVDIVLLSVTEEALHVMLVRREEHPYRGKWALPGGFVGMRESFEDAVDRVLKNKTHLTGVFTEQLYTFGAPDRDPRTRVISVAYFALVDHARLVAAGPGNGNIRLARFDAPSGAPTATSIKACGPNDRKLTLAFDHAEVLLTTINRLRGKLDYAPIGFELLPPLFTLRQLQAVHEAVLARTVNKDSFRRRMLASGFVAPTGQREEGVLHRPAELYRFTRRPQSRKE